MNKAEFIKEHGLSVIFRGIDEEKIPAIVSAIYEGGGRIAEITFDPSDPDTIRKTCSSLRAARLAVPEDMLIGVGTAISEEYVMAAHEAGADFVYSPDTDPDVIRLTKKLGMVSIPGAFTPTECKAAYKYGADIVKLFPTTIDSIGYIVNITRPLSHIPFICTGGANENTSEAFIEAGAVGVGTGVSILKPELVKEGNYAEISRLTRLHLERIRAAKERRAAAGK